MLAARIRRLLSCGFAAVESRGEASARAASYGLRWREKVHASRAITIAKSRHIFGETSNEMNYHIHISYSSLGYTVVNIYLVPIYNTSVMYEQSPHPLVGMFLDNKSFLLIVTSSALLHPRPDRNGPQTRTRFSRI